MKRLTAIVIICTCVFSLNGCSSKNESKSCMTESTPVPTVINTEKTEITPNPTEAVVVKEEVNYSPDKIEISKLDSSVEDWWFGNNVDDSKRPLHPVECQEKLGKYGADFIKESEKKVYLTFDEGYENGFTPSILDTLKNKDCKAVFFITMDFAKSNSDLVERMIKEGHVVGNHSVTHPAQGVAALSESEQESEVMELHKYIKEKYGYNMYLFRYPAGKYSIKSLAIINNLGYKSVFWSFAYLDYDTEKQPDEKESIDKLINKLHPGAIYLLHAVSKTNTDILGEFIDKTRENGYEICDYSIK